MANYDRIRQLLILTLLPCRTMTMINNNNYSNCVLYIYGPTSMGPLGDIIDLLYLIYLWSTSVGPQGDIVDVLYLIYLCVV